mgnify:FL=1|tara:strand:- start:44 stop:424 length:381 start_codon:yes stop_codon:yes gene_type:complete
MIIKKIKKGYLDVPIISKENIIKRGLYVLVFKGEVIKVGIYGEGVNSNNKSRFASYRNKGKYITPGNGSYKTMKILNENLKVGDCVEVFFKKLPEDREIDGYVWKVDLYHEEEKLKNQHKHSLWLT